MGAESSQRKPPGIDTADMIQRRRLQAELASIDGQIRTFGRIRDRLTAAGQDAVAYYRTLEARRAALSADLKSSRAGGAPAPAPGTVIPIPGFSQSLLTRQIAPARFDPELGVFGFGTSGFVQTAPAADDQNIVAQGQYPSAGEIFDVPGGYPGTVQFDGYLEVGPSAIESSQYNTTVAYYWLRTWQYLVPFPPPTMLSNLTYRFDAAAFVSLGRDEGIGGQLMAFVSLGESADLVQGVNVPVTIDGGWPLNYDLSQPGPTYNGIGGYLEGTITVQRTFEVGTGKVPGVAIVVGVAVGLAMMSNIRLYDVVGPRSNLSICSENQAGRIAYSYEPQLIIK